MAEKRKPCKNKRDCDGTINEQACTFIQTCCSSISPVFDCNKCGALHSRDGGHMATNYGSGPTIFWKNDKITDENGGSPYRG